MQKGNSCTPRTEVCAAVFRS
uniref:Uncharacterized protein n=1 Tax=Arundo donax TaxID=35708 RepID=A0A0A9H667_ARUDO